MSESDGVLVVELACAVMYLFTFGKLGAMIARKKNAATRGAFVGMAFGPIGLIIAGFLDERPSCPKCKTRVDPNATICSGCRARLNSPEVDLEDYDDAPETVDFACRHCGDVMTRPLEDVGKTVICDCGEMIKVKGKRPTLRDCQDCRHEISRRAVSCPHCGCPTA